MPRRRIHKNMNFREARRFVVEHLPDFFGNRFDGATYRNGKMCVGNRVIEMEGDRIGCWFDAKTGKWGDVIDMYDQHARCGGNGPALFRINRIAMRINNAAR